MRQVKEFTTTDGKRYRVRFRQGTTETSKTFRAKQDARTFAAILDTGKADNVVEALAWLAGKEQQHKTATFGDYFEAYLSQLTGVTKRTRADYRALHDRYLSHLDDRPLPLVTRADVAGTVNALDDRGLSSKTIKNAVHMLSSVFNLAIDDGLVARNPCRRVRLPKARLGSHEPRFLLPAEFAALVDATAEHYRPLLVFLVGTGMRWSEATALQCRHVNLDAGTIQVRQAWKRIPGGFELGPPKTEKARRTVNPAVMALAAVQPLMRGDNDFVFTTPQGNVVRHSNFYNRVWLPALKQSGLDRDPRPRPHDCRHTHASWLISDGISLEAVQDQLGHESIETTRKVYGALLPAVGVAVGKAASAALERALLHGPQAVGAVTVAPVAAVGPGAVDAAGADEVDDPEGVAAG